MLINAAWRWKTTVHKAPRTRICKQKESFDVSTAVMSLLISHVDIHKLSGWLTHKLQISVIAS